MEIQSFLKEYGFNEKEIKIYLALLQLGQANVGNIAKKAEVKRPTAYIVLEELMRKGFVDLLPKDNKTHYIIKSPGTLLKKLIKKEKLTQSFIPQLMALFNEPKERPKVMYFEGEESVKKIYDDSIKDRKEILAFFGVKEVFDMVGNKFTKEYVRSRIRNKISAKVIVSSEDDVKAYRSRDKEELRKTKIIDSKKFPFEAEIMIYGNKVAVTSFNGSDSFGLIIQNDQFSNTAKSIFNFMWENLSK